MKKRCTAILLAAGKGSRMRSDVAKQYMLLKDKPLMWYALHAIESSAIIDDCILVTGKEELDYVREEIVEKFGFQKVDAIVAGGAQRYLSVGNALDAIAANAMRVPNRDGYVFIHDAARPFLTKELIESMYQAVCDCHACVAAVPSKDTVKIMDETGYVSETPDRNKVWNVQTPQVFDVSLILSAYEKLREYLEKSAQVQTVFTDDASIVEKFTDVKIKLVHGAYENIKITTPEDLKIAEILLK